MPIDEYVDILDENGSYTGRSELKSVAHAEGLYHPTIHVWCYSLDNKVLLQQRGANKSTYPLRWDVSVAGHIAAGESPEVGAIREISEEIGLKISIIQLDEIAVFKLEKKHDNGIWDREFTHMFLLQMDAKTALTKQDSEVEALEWITLQEFENRILKDDPRFVPNSLERYKEVLKEIKLRLQ